MLIHTNKRYIIAFAATTILLIAAVICFVWLLGHHGFLEVREERCYFSSELHLYCPGCGGSRAVLYEWEAWGILVVVLGFFIVRNLLLIFFGIDYLGDMTGAGYFLT